MASRSQPIHRWFKYSAGFSSQWAAQLIEQQRPRQVLDPFVGSGTVCIAADMLGVPSIGVEAHPFVARLASAKASWDCSIEKFVCAAEEIMQRAVSNMRTIPPTTTPELLLKCYTPVALAELWALKDAYHHIESDCPEDVRRLLFLAITALLRPVSHVGTAQWQYVLPNKTKSRTVSVASAFNAQIEIMRADMVWAQTTVTVSRARIVGGDARALDGIPSDIDLVITSPPYANNYDYADATRLEMTFWGDVASWGDLHNTVRRFLVRSSSQHVSKDRLSLEEALNDDVLQPIKREIGGACAQLAEVKESKGGKKNYDAMAAAYFSDMARTFNALRRVVKAGGAMCWVVGDSAPYGIHLPVERWLGELALNAGFINWSFEKLRDRNIKWKNRKHRVPLHEGRLWIKG